MPPRRTCRANRRSLRASGRLRGLARKTVPCPIGPGSNECDRTAAARASRALAMPRPSSRASAKEPDRQRRKRTRRSSPRGPARRAIRPRAGGCFDLPVPPGFERHQRRSDEKRPCAAPRPLIDAVVALEGFRAFGERNRRDGKSSSPIFRIGFAPPLHRVPDESAHESQSVFRQFFQKREERALTGRNGHEFRLEHSERPEPIAPPAVKTSSSSVGTSVASAKSASAAGAAFAAFPGYFKISPPPRYQFRSVPLRYCSARGGFR